MNFLIFSYHNYSSKNKAGFHFIADTLLKLGHKVTFVAATTGILNLLQAKQKRGIKISSLNRMQSLGSSLKIFNLCTILPLISYRNKFVDILLKPLLILQYKFFLNLFLSGSIKNADVIVFESIPLITLANFVKQLNPQVKLVYRVSDLFCNIPNQPDWVMQDEANSIANFDVISVPSRYMYDYYLKILLRIDKLQLDYHGIDTEILSADVDNPYLANTINVVWSGVSQYDAQVVEILAQNFPEIIFHIIGGVTRVQWPNVINYGKMQFDKTISYLKFASVGLANRLYHVGAESLSDSLKIKQYTYFKLPILAPEFMQSYSGNNMFFYKLNDTNSIVSAFKKCLAFNPGNTDLLLVKDWDRVVENIFNLDTA